MLCVVPSYRHNCFSIEVGGPRQVAEHMGEGASKPGACRFTGAEPQRSWPVIPGEDQLWDRPMGTGKETNGFWVSSRPRCLMLLLHGPSKRFKFALLLLLTLDS